MTQLQASDERPTTITPETDGSLSFVKSLDYGEALLRLLETATSQQRAEQLAVTEMAETFRGSFDSEEERATAVLIVRLAFRLGQKADQDSVFAAEDLEEAMNNEMTLNGTPIQSSGTIVSRNKGMLRSNEVASAGAARLFEKGRDYGPDPSN